MNEESRRFLNIIVRFKKLNYKITPMKQLSHTEFMALATVDQYFEEMTKKNETMLGVRVSELTRRLQGSKAATSKILNALEERNFIIRKFDKSDRRVAYIQLTEDGIEVLKHSKEKMDKFVDEIIEKMGKEKVKQFISLFEDFYEIVEGQLELYNQDNASQGERNYEKNI